MDDALHLSRKSLIVVFAYAPAGLGHLRVSRALYEGLPKSVTPVLIGANDTTITYLHRIMSINPLARRLFEWAQNGWPEQVFDAIYRFYLRHQTKALYTELEGVLAQRIDLPTTMLVVATHCGLAIQLAAIKQKLAQKHGVRILLVVVVTDDSPQSIWYVDGADLTLVPSDQTKEDLLRYARRHYRHISAVETISYPVSPTLQQRLNAERYVFRHKQLMPEEDTEINVSVPISGAAVGTAYTTTLIDQLHTASHKFTFHVFARTTQFNSQFIKQMMLREKTVLHVSDHDRGIVEVYEDVLKTHTMSLEITKPSEQAFKVLFKPSQVGGVLLLFSQPVGRQEYDNISFLQRHYLIPDNKTREKLYSLATSQTSLAGTKDHYLLDQASYWRGLQLPKDPVEAASFIMWCRNQKIFAKMLACQVHPKNTDEHAHELYPNGVEHFWQRIEQGIASAQ